MFEYDGSGLASYWDEVLVSEAICDPGVHIAYLDVLLETRGEPIERSFVHYCHHIACCIRRPQDLARHLLRDLVRGFTGGELVLPPIDAQLERNREIDNALKPYLGTARYRISEQDVCPLHGMVQRPLEHARTKAVIRRCEDWLYPGGGNAFSSLGIDMVWEPWEDHYTDATLWEDLFGCPLGGRHARLPPRPAEPVLFVLECPTGNEPSQVSLPPAANRRPSQ